MCSITNATNFILDLTDGDIACARYTARRLSPPKRKSPLILNVPPPAFFILCLTATYWPFRPTPVTILWSFLNPRFSWFCFLFFLLPPRRPSPMLDISTSLLKKESWGDFWTQCVSCFQHKWHATTPVSAWEGGVTAVTECASWDSIWSMTKCFSSFGSGTAS